MKKVIGIVGGLGVPGVNVNGELLILILHILTLNIN